MSNKKENQVEASNAFKGSLLNPYSKTEYESMSNDGEWGGGYVEGQGYASSTSSDSDSSFDSSCSTSESSQSTSDCSSSSSSSSNTNGSIPSSGGSSGTSGSGSSYGGTSGTSEIIITLPDTEVTAPYIGTGTTWGGYNNPYPIDSSTSHNSNSNNSGYSGGGGGGGYVNPDKKNKTDYEYLEFIINWIKSLWGKGLSDQINFLVKANRIKFVTYWNNKILGNPAYD